MVKTSLVFMIVLVVAATAAFAQTGMDDKGYNIHGRPADRAAVERLMDESIVPADVVIGYGGRTVKQVKGRFPVSTVRPMEESAADFISRHGDAFGLGPRAGLRPGRKKTDELGFTHIVLRQTYDNIPVWGEDFQVHVNGDDEMYLILSNNTRITVPDTTPDISAEQALDTAVNSITGDEKNSLSSQSAELVLLPGEGGAVLCFRVTLTFGARWDFFIDANSGQLIKRENTTDY